MMADPLANVNRWRGEVGLPQVTADELAKVTEPIEIDGQQATLVDAVPDASKHRESKADRGTLAAMLNTGDTIWFFKMTGDRDLVAAERDQFKAFLKSVRFKAERRSRRWQQVKLFGPRSSRSARDRPRTRFHP